MIDAFDCMTAPELLASAYSGASWNPSKALMLVAEGRHRELTPELRAYAEEFSGRKTFPDSPVAEYVEGGGRGGGKTSRALAQRISRALRTYPRAPGERIKAYWAAPTIQQSTQAHERTLGLLEQSEVARQLIENVTSHVISLSNGVDLETRPADFKTIRGASMCCAVVDEACFLPTGENAKPDRELLRAVRPALARVPGSLLVLISSVYAQRGELYWYLKEGFGRE